MKPANNTLHEKLDKVLTELENAVEHSTMRRVANRQDASNSAIHAKARQDIRQLITDEKRALLERLEAKQVNRAGVDVIHLSAIQKEKEKL